MKIKGILLATAAAATLSACAVQPQQPTVSAANAPVPAPVSRGDINPGYAAGRVEMQDIVVPSLDELQGLEAALDEMATEEDKLRRPAQREAALALGVKGGLAWESKRINMLLKRKSSELSRIYDFNRLIIRGPDESMVLPPVISEAKANWESQDAGKTLRTADNVFEIISDPVFVPNAPMWHTYLVRSYTTPDLPPDALLPANEAERTLWKKWVSEGWMMGIKQAHMIFEADMRRLERDFVGMVRYKKLLAQNMVSEPVVSEGRLGVTASDDGRKMRVDDRAIRIMRDSILNPNSGEWDSRQDHP